MSTTPVALVTGANQGIGFQIATELAAHRFTVLVGSRNLERGEVAAREIGPNAVALQLDVTDHISITAAAERVRTEFGRLDVLVQNAAIATALTGEVTSEELAQTGRPSVIPMQDIRRIWETNVFGVLAVYQAMLPVLRMTPGARIVNISSGAGSLTLNAQADFPLRSGFDAGYCASKTALNGLTLAMAIELEPEGIRVNVVSPGYTRTRLTGFAGTDTVEQGAAEAVRLALLEDRTPTGTFTHAEHGALPW
ncbi:SDR family NAD(P)-dependent oxidoreductase [Pelagibacterium sp. H642]|uniref:SDR family NAD(P)-dependent oxidoreductase n=1 Tax=Pelagibacterium sp. H642 TaxID=1881069 RepID=UPI002814CA81|nr:SDR family NAD(P)-dependent oxidoreductase [Pelagibacterium sp. H642]WMT91930.1 SDR family NAD(P)-dependent oxidoreductase [Pelagibacterium sp. H642]